MSVKSYSIVEYYAEHEKYKCGYCKSPDTNFSHGMWAHSMTVKDYQDLIDRGWRRSGSYCYKPTMDQTCCPMYTIKSDVLEFKVTKSQKKILKRMAKFLRGEIKNGDTMDTSEAGNHDQFELNTLEVPNYSKRIIRAQKNVSAMNVTSVSNELDERLHSNAGIANTSASSSSAAKSKTDDVLTPVLLEGKKSTTVMGLSPSKIPPKKAKLMRLERKQNKLLAQGKSAEEIQAILKQGKQQNSAKTLEDIFAETSDGPNKLELRLVRTSPMSSEYKKTAKQSYEVYRKYQTTIHGVPAEKTTEQQYTRFLLKSPLQIKLVKVMSDEFLDTVEASLKLYKKYQMAIHDDPPEDCDKKSFLNFLARSPLQEWTPINGPPHGFGSFHEQYWLNDELIAVGVIDILPSCVSSVYFFYDPAYSHLSLGTYGSLHEVKLTRELNKLVPELKHYYMGFYIHTCPKMRYKAGMRPSKLLCPETYVWYDIERCIPKLDKEKYSRLNEDLDAIDENGIINIDRVLVLYHERAMPYRIYKDQIRRNIADENEVREYASLVGMKCAQSLLLYRS